MSSNKKKGRTPSTPRETQDEVEFAGINNEEIVDWKPSYCEVARMPVRHSARNISTNDFDLALKLAKSDNAVENQQMILDEINQNKNKQDGFVEVRKSKRQKTNKKLSIEDNQKPAAKVCKAERLHSKNSIGKSSKQMNMFFKTKAPIVTKVKRQTPIVKQLKLKDNKISEFCQPKTKMLTRSKQTIPVPKVPVNPNSNKAKKTNKNKKAGSVPATTTPTNRPSYVVPYANETTIAWNERLYNCTFANMEATAVVPPHVATGQRPPSTEAKKKKRVEQKEPSVWNTLKPNKRRVKNQCKKLTESEIKQIPKKPYHHLPAKDKPKFLKGCKYAEAASCMKMNPPLWRKPHFHNTNFKMGTSWFTIAASQAKNPVDNDEFPCNTPLHELIKAKEIQKEKEAKEKKEKEEQEEATKTGLPIPKSKEVKKSKLRTYSLRLFLKKKPKPLFSIPNKPNPTLKITKFKQKKPTRPKPVPCYGMQCALQYAKYARMGYNTHVKLYTAFKKGDAEMLKQIEECRSDEDVNELAERNADIVELEEQLVKLEKKQKENKTKIEKLQKTIYQEKIENRAAITKSNNKTVLEMARNDMRDKKIPTNVCPRTVWDVGVVDFRKARMACDAKNAARKKRDEKYIHSEYKYRSRKDHYQSFVIQKISWNGQGKKCKIEKPDTFVWNRLLIDAKVKRSQKKNGKYLNEIPFKIEHAVRVLITKCGKVYFNFQYTSEFADCQHSPSKNLHSTIALDPGVRTMMSMYDADNQAIEWGKEDSAQFRYHTTQDDMIRSKISSIVDARNKLLKKLEAKIELLKKESNLKSDSNSNSDKNLNSEENSDEMSNSNEILNSNEMEIEILNSNENSNEIDNSNSDDSDSDHSNSEHSDSEDDSDQYCIEVAKPTKPKFVKNKKLKKIKELSNHLLNESHPLQYLEEQLKILTTKSKWDLKSLNRASARKKHKIKNKIKECHNKLAQFLCENYCVILIPKFDVSQMTKRKNSDGSSRKIHKNTVRDMLHWSHFRFRQLLLEKAELYPWVSVVVVTEAYTSKTCGKCGVVDTKLGGKKKFKCPKCNHHADRDIHAAKNILMRYLTIEKILVEGS